MHAATVVTRRYLSFARTLAEGLHAHDPAAKISVLVVDAEPGELEEPFTVLTIEQVGLDRAEIAHRRAIFDDKELACSLKAPLLLQLVSSTGDAVVYFDADIHILGSHDAMCRAALEHGVVLTRHIHCPVAESFERQLLHTGVFQGGLVAVSTRGADFLRWWTERTARDCREDVAAGLYFDQRWLELVPSMFDHHIVNDPGINVTSQVLETRNLQIDGGGYRIAGSPVRSFHFGGGFDPNHPLGATANALTPSSRPSRIPAFSRLMAGYREALLRNGWGETSALSRRFQTFAGGVELDVTMRRLYREQLLRARQTGAKLPPDPFGPDDGAAFLSWLSTPVDYRRDAARVSRYLYELRGDRPDLSTRFPDLVAGAASAYLQYVEAHIPEIPTRLRRPVEPVAAHAAEGPFELRPGVNVVGAPEGLAHRVSTAARAAGVDCTFVAWERHEERRAITSARAVEANYDVNVLCLSDTDIPDFDHDLGATFRPWRYGVAYWDEEPGSGTGPALTLVDEVWTTSERLATVLAGWTEKPVTAIPRVVTPIAAEGSDAPDLPKRRMLGVAVDLAHEGRQAVKRVQQVLHAVERLPGEVGVVVVLSGVTSRLADAERVHAWAGQGSHARVVEIQGSGREVDVVARLDGYLEVAERLTGRGNLLAATASGVPVIAPSDALDTHLAEAIAVKLDNWEPDTLTAALHEWTDSPDGLRARAQASARLIAATHSAEVVGARIVKRLNELTADGSIPVGPRDHRETFSGARRARS